MAISDMLTALLAARPRLYVAYRAIERSRD